MSDGRSSLPVLLRLLLLLLLPALAGHIAFRQASRSFSVGEGDALEALLHAPRCESLPANPKDPAWDAVRPLSVRLRRMALGQPSAPTVDTAQVRALASGGDVAFLVEWEHISAGASPTPSDSIAIQLPAGRVVGGQLPSVSFGDPANPVRLWIWGGPRGVMEVVSSGPASFQASNPVASSRVRSESACGPGARSVMLRGRPDAPLSSVEPLPFAIYVWDGRIGDTGASAYHLSRWHGLIVEESLPLAALVRGSAAGLGVLLIEWAVLLWLRRPRC